MANIHLAVLAVSGLLIILVLLRHRSSQSNGPRQQDESRNWHWRDIVLAIGFIVGIYLGLFSRDHYPLVDKSWPISGAFQFALMATPLCLGAIYLLRGSLFTAVDEQYPYQGFGKYRLIFGVPAILFLAFLIMAPILNGSLDTSPEQAHEVKLVSIFHHLTGKEHPLHSLYFVSTESWLAPNAEENFDILPARVTLKQGQALVQVVTKAGWLGHEWVVRIEPAPDHATPAR